MKSKGDGLEEIDLSMKVQHGTQSMLLMLIVSMMMLIVAMGSYIDKDLLTIRVS